VAMPDGSRVARASAEAAGGDWRSLADGLVDRLRAQDADGIIAASRR